MNISDPAFLKNVFLVLRMLALHCIDHGGYLSPCNAPLIVKEKWLMFETQGE